MNLPRQELEQIVLGGGYDQVTPTLSLKPGFFRRGSNFECSINGGYTRIAGYECFDGSAVPSEADYQILYVNLTEPVEQGYTVTGGSSGATAVVVDILTIGDGVALLVTDVNGEFDYEGESISVAPLFDPAWDNVWSLVHFEEYSDEGAGELKCEKGKALVSDDETASHLSESFGVFGKGWSGDPPGATDIAWLVYTDTIPYEDLAVSTIEWRYKKLEATSSHYAFAYSSGMVQVNSPTNDQLEFFTPSGSINVTEPIEIDRWYAMCIVFDTDTAYFFIDGQLQGTAAASFFPGPTGVIEFGAETSPWGACAIDEVRITLGVARYTSDYIVAGAPFPNVGAA